MFRRSSIQPVCHLQVNSIANFLILLVHYLPWNIEWIFSSYDPNVHLSEIFLSLVQHKLFHKSSPLKPLNQIWVKFYFHNDIIRWHRRVWNFLFHLPSFVSLWLHRTQDCWNVLLHLSLYIVLFFGYRCFVITFRSFGFRLFLVDLKNCVRLCWLMISRPSIFSGVTVTLRKYWVQGL